MDGLEWPNDQPVLILGDLKLRAWKLDDAAAMFEACQDPEIHRWTTIPSPYLREHADGFVGEFAKHQWSSREGAPFCIENSDGRMLGNCGLVAVDEDRLVAEVGYWVAPQARGGRVAERAVRMLSDWALSNGGIHRLELYIEPTNLASVKVAERVGCVREGLLRSKAIVRGTRRDMLLYALVR